MHHPSSSSLSPSPILIASLLALSSLLSSSTSLLLLTSWAVPSHPFVLQKSLRSPYAPHLPNRPTPKKRTAAAAGMQRHSSSTIPPFHTSHNGGYSTHTADSIILAASTSPDGDDASTTMTTIASEEKLMEYASTKGVAISITTLGPGYRAVARAAHDEEQILGYCEGFIRPGGKILHVDKLEVWKKALQKAISTSPTSPNATTTEFQKAAGTVFGISLLLGFLCLLHGRTSGCERAEFLAIDDEPFQHKRLVRFFRRAGFRVIRYVGEGLADVPDRMVWGGCGTLMNRDIDGLLMEWNGILFRKR